MDVALAIVIATLVLVAVVTAMVVWRGGWSQLRKRAPTLAVVVVLLVAFGVVVGAGRLDPAFRGVVIFAEAVGVALLWFFALRGKLPIGHALVGTVGLLLTVVPPN